MLLVVAEAQDSLVVRHQPAGWRGAFVVDRDGKRLAEMTYRHTNSKRIVVDHTLVEPALRGRGVARQLLEALVAWAREAGICVAATCSYVREQFERDATLADVHDA